MGTRARSIVQFKGQSVFVEAEARRTQFYRSGDLSKYLGRLGCKLEDFQTSQAIIVTADLTKCTGVHQVPSPMQPSPVKQAPIYESRAQKQLRLAREKATTPKSVVTPNPKRQNTKDKNQKLYHIDRFEKIVKRAYHAFRRSNESTSIPSGSPKPVNQVNYKTPSKYSPAKRLVERNLPEPRQLIKPFLRIDDAEGVYRPTFIESIPIPILKTDSVENDGCPFAGYDKKHREAKKKLAKKMGKAGNCEICDAKFDDEESHVKSAQHQTNLEKKRGTFQKLVKSCEQMFPNGFDGFLNRLEEFHAGDIPSPMPISVLTEPDSELSAPSEIIPCKRPERLKELTELGADLGVITEVEVNMTEELFENEGTENVPPLGKAPEDETGEKNENAEFTKYRNQKHIESSFEKKSNENSASLESNQGDDIDWMFNQTTDHNGPSNKTDDPERKISTESCDSMMQELERLGTLGARTDEKEKRDEVNMTIEDFEYRYGSVFKSDNGRNPSETSRKISSESHKRKSTPAKGTYNPSVLEQLATTSPKSNSGIATSKTSERHIQSDFSKLSDSTQSPIISKNAHQLKTTLPSPKPPPMPLNLDAARSPALKKAMMENPAGQKRQVETLRNLRGELSTEIVRPNLTPVPRELTRIRNDEPLPAPVMSAILVSPKDKKTASTNPSPMDGKEYTALQPTSSKSILSSLDQVANENPDYESEIETIENNSYITINNENDDSESKPIAHADQFEFKTPTKTPGKRVSIPRKEELSPFIPFSPSESDFGSNPSLSKTSRDLKSPAPAIPVYDQNTTADQNEKIYHDFASIPRKASFEGENGKEVELFGGEHDTTDEAAVGSASSLICDPEHEIITTKKGKIQKPGKTSSALRGLDQSTIFRDSPRSTQRRSKLNAFNGLSAHHYDDSSDVDRTPLKQKQRSSGRNYNLQKSKEKIFTLEAYAYNEDDEDDDLSCNSKAYSKRNTRKSRSAKKSATSSAIDQDALFAAGIYEDVSASIEVQQVLDKMSPNSKQVYFESSNTQSNIGNTRRKKTNLLESITRESIIKTPDSSSSAQLDDDQDSDPNELPATPPDQGINIEDFFTEHSTEDDDFSPPPYQPPPPRQSSRKAKRSQYKPKTERIRRQQERSCRTRKVTEYGEGIRGFDSSSEDDIFK